MNRAAILQGPDYGPIFKQVYNRCMPACLQKTHYHPTTGGTGQQEDSPISMQPTKVRC